MRLHVPPIHSSTHVSPHSPFQFLAMFYWWFWGYKTFTGPQTNFGTRSANDSKAELEDEKEK